MKSDKGCELLREQLAELLRHTLQLRGSLSQLRLGAGTRDAAHPALDRLFAAMAESVARTTERLVNLNKALVQLHRQNGDAAASGPLDLRDHARPFTSRRPWERRRRWRTASSQRRVATCG